ncbi:MAG: DUF2723 domain-containing protein [Myxococcales bacterium]|nr:DUF2723 domain-containing protein [Myxococcales bacterium]
MARPRIGGPEVAFAAALVVLMARVPVDVGPRDTGELTAASWVLGVSHPTGSPLCLLLEGLGSALPVGTIVFRHGLVMALCTALAAALLARVVATAARVQHRLAELAVGIGIGAAVLAPTLLRAATMTEVYAPTLLLFGITLAIAHEAPHRATLLGALVGLSLAAHPTARLLVPLLVVGAVVRALAARGVRGLAPFVVGGLSTAGLVLYVPVAAARLPALSWGDPRTVGAFHRHFWATDLRATFAERTHGHLLADALAYGRTTLLDLGVPLLSLGVLGLALGLVRGRGPRLLAFAVLADVAYAVKVNPMGIADRQVGHVALLGLAALAGLVVLELARALPLALALTAACTVGVVARAAPELVGDEGALVARLFTVPGALSRLPPRALVVCDGDDSCGGLLYAQLVEGARPDVGVLPRPFADRATYLAARLGQVREDLDRALIRRDRPVFVQGGDKGYPFGVTVTPGALPLLEVSGPRRADAHTRLSALDRALSADGLPPLSRWVLAQAHLGPIGATIASGDFVQAEVLASLALGLDASLPALWNNRAVARASRGELVGALGDVDEALRLDPERVPALVNRASWLLSLGDLARAEPAVARLSAVCRGCAQARILGAALAIRAGRAGEQALLTLAAEQKSKPELWCRAFGLAGLAAPTTCRP